MFPCEWSGMRRIAAVLGLGIALASCSSDPRVPWIGRYRGELVTSSTDCTTGEVFAPAVNVITVEVVEVGDDRIGINGGCLVQMDLLGRTGARVVSSSCNTTLEDGTPVTFETTSGAAMLDGDELSFDFSGRIVLPTACDYTRSDFVGYRQ
jgi:hypothetical protein